MHTEIQSTVEHENAYWSKIFEAELAKNDNNKFSSFWWEDYYISLTKFINNLLIKKNLNDVLEAGSGSGKATLLLEKHLNKCLLDISPIALKYAKHLANKLNVQDVEYHEGDIFSMPFDNEQFDFIWNIGVIEHYSIEEIRAIIKEMFRVCKKHGIVAVGIPNRYSGPIIKAWLLKLLKFIPGYKLDTEKFYNVREIETIFKEVSIETDKEIKCTCVQYFGNPLIMETPAVVIKTVGKVITTLLKKNRFLVLVTCEFK